MKDPQSIAAGKTITAESMDDPTKATMPATAALAKLAEEDEPELVTKKSGSDSSDHQATDDDHSESSDITDVAIAVAGDLDEEINAAPMHLHALSSIPNARLVGMVRRNSDGKLVNAAGASKEVGRRSRSASRTRSHGGSGTAGGRRSANSSRSSSPLPTTKQHADSEAHVAGGRLAGDASTAYSTAHSKASTGHNSIHSGHSSLDGIYDPDVLLDRLGFIDLDPPLPHEIRCGPLAAPGALDGKSNNSGGLTPVNERLSEETLEDCHAFTDLVMIDNLKHISGAGHMGGMSSTMSMPSVAHSSLSGMRSDMSVGSLSVGSFKGGTSRGGSVAGGSLMGDGENSVLLGTLDEEGEDEESVQEAVEVGGD